MELGMIGLGRMGGNMALRLIQKGHRVVVFDPVAKSVEELVKQGAVGASSIPNLTKQLTSPRTVWVMVPAGEPTENVISTLANALSPGDTIIDGGNSNYKDSMRRASNAKMKGLFFLDAGTSGGIWGLKEGYCLMIGGDKKAFKQAEPIFQSLAPAKDKGYGYVGPSGAGHFVKMVHNGTEYALMQSYAEGLELMEAKKEFDLDLAQVAEIWRYGSVVRSWLLDMTALALKDNPKLKNIQAYVEDSGEGRWTVQESIDLGVPLPVIALSLQARFRSRQEQPFGARLLAALRNKFGGHAVKKIE
ncbi:MAG: decarboxylating 6-phosphogluconate dehydrogenase [Dehalococcoidia bacterium]|nr:decarboxylating 6-phosphogluconate dehydrogenase [Dehalococcoidia bacterium]